MMLVSRHSAYSFRRGLDSVVVVLGRILLGGILIWGLLPSGSAKAQPPVRHQVFSDIVQSFLNGLPFEDFSSEIGFRYAGASTVPGVSDPCGCADLGSDDFLLNIPNSKAWSDADPDQTPGFQHAFKNEVRFLFRGSGLDMLYAAHPVGEGLAWEIVDGGSEGAFTPVASGNFSTFNAATTLNTAQLAAPGSLPTDKLHMLRVWPQESGGGPATPRWISLDAFDVYGSKKFSIDDSLNLRLSDGNPGGSWIPSPAWGNDFDANSIPSIGGGITRSTTDNATMTVLFNGGSLAIFGRQIAGATATFDWIIDGGGAGLEGTIDQTLDSNSAYRWPHVLVNGLSHDEHTLEITVKNNGGTGTAGALGPKPQLEGGFTELDAISVVSFADLEIAADFDLNKTVDGADFLQWQRGFGIQPSATRGEGDANRDEQINNIDLLIWQREFGNSVPTATVSALGVSALGASVLGASALGASVLGVPEPSGAALACFALLIHQYVRRR